MTVSVLWLFLTVQWVGLQCMIVVFTDHSHLLLFMINQFIRKIAKCGRSVYFFCFFVLVFVVVVVVVGLFVFGEVFYSLSTIEGKGFTIIILYFYSKSNHIFKGQLK